MKPYEPSMTAKLCAFTRAYHSRFSRDKIHDDYLAYELLGEHDYEGIKEDLTKKVKGAGIIIHSYKSFIDELIAPIVLARMKYTEDRLESFVKENQGEDIQYVVCGAGLDSFIFRNDNPKIKVFELDHPSTSQYKRSRIKSLGWELKEGSKMLAIDFEKESIREVLLKNGFDKTKKTFFAILGVTYYIEHQTLKETLEEIYQLTSNEVRIVFDYGEGGEKSERRMKRLQKLTEELGEMMKEGLKAVYLLKALKGQGYQVTHHLTPYEIQLNYFNNRKDTLKAFSNVHFLEVEKMKAINTKLIHAGVDGDERTGAVNVPIYQTSTFKQIELLKHTGYEYSRTGNPTREAVEKLLAELEEGKQGFAFASGMAAITAVLSLFKAHDKLIISKNVYGGTYRLLSKIFSQFKIAYQIVDTTDLKEVERNLTESVKAVFIESPANPLMTVTDISKLAQTVHRKGKLLIVDNTFMTPYLQRPLTLGADIVVHSATKYLSGHSDIIAGAVVTDKEELAERLAFIQNATGGILQPFDAYLLLRSIKTLGVRMERHQKNAQRVAEWLTSQKEVKQVYYPGLKEDKGYQIQKKQADGAGGMIAFELEEGHDVKKFFKHLKLIILAESLGGVESLVCHPASMTHASIPEAIRKEIGIKDTLIRLSVGIEEVEDIISDLKQAISHSSEENN